MYDQLMCLRVRLARKMRYRGEIGSERAQVVLKLRCVLKPQQGRREGTRCRSDLIPPTKLKQGWDGLGPQIRVRVGTAKMSPASTQCGLRSGETRWGSGGHLPQQDVTSLNSVWVEVRRDALSASEGLDTRFTSNPPSSQKSLHFPRLCKPLHTGCIP